ncbi:MAG: NYN domain-containing protein [Candidatus Sungbacteria bacterium]|uniref:NYN domain-containing protein n=1 Tax=Candidatus Sungiibacteriota bacterium TaxID=2750080 RepID=A0A9D6LSN2_9BACT|nr:NYN domain-containing protein [Candidatus Sungbacteria bacterium]
MIGKFIKGRVAVFIDAANIFYSQRTLGWRISYEKLKDYFDRECDISAMFVYTATDGTRQEQVKFVSMLKRSGFIVRTKPVKKIRIAHGVYQWKGNFDVELTMDILDGVSSYDTALLMSGDSDFAPVIDRIKARGKWVLVMSVKGHVSKELLDRAKYINLKKLRKEIELTNNKIPPHEAGRGSS